MKTKQFFFVAALCLAVLYGGNSCRPIVEPYTPEEIDPGEGKDDNPEDNPEDNPGDNPGGGSTLAGADIFKAFDTKGNIFWYIDESSSSCVQYGKGRQTSKETRCIGWEVIEAAANYATVHTYVNFDFNHPTTITFSRGADGSLFMNDKQVTNTQSPVFYRMNFGKKGSYEWKELYSNGKYTNIFYTKSNGYTATAMSHDITEVWNEYGLFSSRYSSMSSDATIGSYSSVTSLKRVKTAYNALGDNLTPVEGVTLTGIKNTTIYNNPYVKANPGAESFEVTFTQNGQNTWGYCLGMYLKGDDGQAKWFPVYRIQDIHDYVKSYFKGYNGYGGDDLVKGVTDFSTNTHSIDFFITPKAVQLGQSMASKRLDFCVFALGYGEDLVSIIEEPKAMFSIDFSKPGMPAKIVKTDRALAPVLLR